MLIIISLCRYPSKKYLNRYESINKDNTNEEINVSSRNITNSPLDQGDIRVVEKNTQAKNDTKSSKSVLSKEEVNFIKLNKEHTTVTNKIATQMNNNTSNNSNNNNLPTNYRMGVVPRYVNMYYTYIYYYSLIRFFLIFFTTNSNYYISDL